MVGRWKERLKKMGEANEQARSTETRRLTVNRASRIFGGPKSPWHLDMTLGDSPFDKSALARRKQVELFERKVWVASPEDLLIYKLVAWRDRDVMDVNAIVKRQKSLDVAYLKKWIAWW